MNETIWLDYAGLAKHIGRARSYCRQMQHEGLLPPSVGTHRARRWDRTVVDAWMRSPKYKAASRAMTKVREKQLRKRQRGNHAPS
jgi:hypothetical protein